MILQKSLLYFFQKNFVAIVLCCLIGVGLALRLVGQPAVPWGFHRDEAGILYNAWSIITTGRDEWGSFLPIHFRMFGDYPPGGYVYLVSLLIPVFGVQPFTERLPAIFFGTVLIPLSYWLVRRWWPEMGKRGALAVSLLVTISPWGIVQSRAGSEAMVALVWGLLSLVFWPWNKRILSKKITPQWQLAVSIITALLSMFTYNAAKLAIPLLLTATTVNWLLPIHKISFQNLLQKIRTSFLLLLFLWLIAVVSVFGNTELSRRWSDVNSLVSSSRTEVNIAHITREGIFGVPVVWTRIIHNKYQVAGFAIAREYLSYFSPEFLFFSGGYPSRYRVPGFGVLPIVIIPFLFWGIWQTMFLSRKHKSWRWLLIWLLIAPCVAALTNEESPNVRRVLFEFWPLSVLTAVGITEFWKMIKYRWLKIFGLTLFLGFIIWNTGAFVTSYVVQGAYETVHHRSYGYDQVFSRTEQWLAEAEDHQQVIVLENTDTPYIHLLLAKKVVPKEYQLVAKNNPQNLFSKKQQTWSFGHYTFRAGDCPKLAEWQSAVLFVVPAEACPKSIQAQWKLIEIVKSTDAMPLFVLAEGWIEE